MRAAAVSWAYAVPGLQIYLFRRNFPDLEKNHLYGESGLFSLLANYMKSGHVSYNGRDHAFKFWNGSIIYLCHLDNQRSLTGYQGAEIHVLLMDELTQFLDDEYRYLRARCRMGGLKVPEGCRWKFPRILSSANPGGVGHQWVKSTFIDGADPLMIRAVAKEEGGMLRQYVPARLADNPTMEKEYADKLYGLGSPEMVRAWLEGDWEITAGAAFEKLTRSRNGVRPFAIPRHWTRFTSMDWGTAKPFSVGWYAVVEGETLVKGRDGEPDVSLPDGALVRYREYYGWNGKPDNGCRMESYKVAHEMLKIEREANEPQIDYRIADSGMWAQTDGPSPQERIYTETEGQVNLRQAEKDRSMNYLECRARVAGDDERAMFYCFTNCQHFWRTVPTLQLDSKNPEKGPDSAMEDHVYDEWAYACRSRPYKTTQIDRIAVAYRKAKKAAGVKNANPYRLRK